MSRAVVALYVLHPMVTSEFFAAFKCARSDAEGMKYDTMRLLNRMVIDGVPVLLVVQLHRNRHALHSSSMLTGQTKYVRYALLSRTVAPLRPSSVFSCRSLV